MSRTSMKRVERLRISFTLTKDFDRTKKMSDAELDKLRAELHKKIGWYPRKFNQRIVHAFVTPEANLEKDRVAITGKIQRK